MILERLSKFAALLLWFLLTTSLANAQSNNLLENHSANDGADHWRVFGNATIEQTPESNPYFTVRNNGYFLQDVTLPEGSVGKYVLLIGRVLSERINADGAITGLPSLYGYMMEGAPPRGGRILSYLQGQQMLCKSNKENEWVTAWGIFQVPDGTGAIRYFLSQAERKDIPQNGSAARFDDLGIYLFNTEEEASAFIEKYKVQTE
jgi:hypothetical protein